jgi:hypothetical protein
VQVATTGAVAMAGSATLTVPGRAQGPDAPVDERIGALRQHIAAVETPSQ